MKKLLLKLPELLVYLKIENLKFEDSSFELNCSKLNDLDWRNSSCNLKLLTDSNPLVLVSKFFFKFASVQFKSSFKNIEIWV